MVNSSISATELSREQASNLFLKKARWAEGPVVQPIDLKIGSDIRESFSTQIHGKSPKQVKSYWRKQMFAGKSVPPPEAKSDADVLRYVAKRTGAIGYVATDTELVEGTREIKLKR